MEPVGAAVALGAVSGRVARPHAVVYFPLALAAPYLHLMGTWVLLRQNFKTMSTESKPHVADNEQVLHLRSSIARLRFAHLPGVLALALLQPGGEVSSGRTISHNFRH